MNSLYNVGKITGTNISLQVTVGTIGVAHTMVYLNENLIAESNTQSGNISIFIIDTSDKLKGHSLTIDTWITFTGQVPAESAHSDMALHYFLNGGPDEQQVFSADTDDITNSSAGANSFIEKVVRLI